MALESYSNAEKGKTAQKWSRQPVRQLLTFHFTHKWGSLLLCHELMILNYTVHIHFTAVFQTLEKFSHKGQPFF
jgi:hypothetical protein